MTGEPSTSTKKGELIGEICMLGGNQSGELREKKLLVAFSQERLDQTVVSSCLVFVCRRQSWRSEEELKETRE